MKLHSATIVLMFLGGWTAACTSTAKAGTASVAQQANVAGKGENAGGDAAAIYQRATVQFEEACFYKPVEEQGDELTFKLAPLIIEEVKSNGFTGCRNRFGAITFERGVMGVDVSQPALYVHTDTVQLNSNSHARLTYLWFYDAESSANSNRGLISQAVRITLNSSGEPTIWEVLNDSSGLQILFVSQNLESAAFAEFGKALPGRRHAVEGPTEKTSGLKVARIIDDGPMPMGPILYLRGTNSDVVTLICRCMPAQAKKLAGTGNYRLARWQDHLHARPDGVPFWPQYFDKRLETGLRLPKKF